MFGTKKETPAEKLEALNVREKAAHIRKMRVEIREKEQSVEKAEREAKEWEGRRNDQTFEETQAALVMRKIRLLEELLTSVTVAEGDSGLGERPPLARIVDEIDEGIIKQKLRELIKQL
jgi:predicted ribosome quality control (RQC) complex YloA/Tae2 family protein